MSAQLREGDRVRATLANFDTGRPEVREGIVGTVGPLGSHVRVHGYEGDPCSGPGFGWSAWVALDDCEVLA